MIDDNSPVSNSTLDEAATHKNRYVRIFLVDGEPEGIRSAQIDISITLAIAFKGDQLTFGVKKEYANQLKSPGVYLIIGFDPENPDNRLVYVGESEDVGKRLNIHKGIVNSNADDSSEKLGLTFWEDTLVFVSKDRSLTKSHIRYVEAALIAAVDGKNGWCHANGQKPAALGKLLKEEASVMNKFITEIKILTGALGFDIFKVSKAPASSSDAGQAFQTENPQFTFSGTDFNATALFLVGSTGKWLVRANSVAKLNHSAATPKGSVKLRNQLESNGTLKKTSNGLIFMADYEFTSASSAASVVAGTSVAGPTAWKINGKTYREWEIDMAGEAPSAAPDLLSDL